MLRKKFGTEYIVAKLRRVRGLVAQGKKIAVVFKEVETTDKSSGLNV